MRKGVTYAAACPQAASLMETAEDPVLAALDLAQRELIEPLAAKYIANVTIC